MARHDDPETHFDYQAGGYETVAHMLACCISQWISHDSEPTSDICTVLRLDEHPKRHQIRRRLATYLKSTNHLN